MAAKGVVKKYRTSTELKIARVSQRMRSVQRKDAAAQSNANRNSIKLRIATAARFVILAPMPQPEINATQLWLISQSGSVAEVERRLSVVEELESVVTANLQRATRLRQSILQKAFTGELI